MINPNLPNPWFRERVLYQIYVLSFADSNGDGYGDIQGVIDHLDDIGGTSEQSLGAGAIWLSPIYRSPMADWGYDVADYCDIDPRFGTLADFDRLMAEAHQRDIKVMLDFVPNHTSIEHEWFRESRSARASKKRDWYIWADPKPDGSPPNNWLNRFHGSAWTLDEGTGQYYMHSFLAAQPDLNWSNPEVEEAMLKVLGFWLARGVDGFRTDAVGSLFKDPQLRDDPPNPDYDAATSDPTDKFLRTYSSMESGASNVLGSFCRVVAGHENTYLVSEADHELTNLRRLYDSCREAPIHAPFNFNLMHLEWKATTFREFIDEYEAILEPEDWPNYVLGTHDLSRLVSRVGAPRARLMALIQLSLRGMPVIYNGEELALENGVVPPSMSRDPGTEHQGHGVNRDRARTPYPWNGDKGAGFTTGTPWLPISDDYVEHNVASESRDPNSMLEFYRHVIHLRSATTALKDGSYRSVEAGNDQVFAYARESSQHRCYVITNFSDSAQTVKLGSIGKFVAGTHEVSGTGVAHTGGEIKLLPLEGRIYEMRQADAT